ncbi:transposase [Streptomyces sp. NPDC056544]|uniref:transposase n=1 Tax=unclassified Streptomyces TaxID=2593676 RepID=UPI0036A69A72
MPEHRRGHGAAYGALTRGRIDVERLRTVLAGLSLPRFEGGRLVLAVAVSPWLRSDAPCSADGPFCHVYGRAKSASQFIPGWPYSFVAVLEPRRHLVDRDPGRGPARARGRRDRGHRRPVEGRDRTAHRLIIDRHVAPLAVALTGGNRHDVTQLLPLLDAITPIRACADVPAASPGRLYADRGYDVDTYRRLLWTRGIKPLIARRDVAHGSGLGKVRWVVERTFAWLCTSSNDSAPATNDAPTSTPDCSNWPAA